MRTTSRLFTAARAAGLASVVLSGAAAAALAVASLGCHAGTPAAPEGTEIPVTCEFLSRDVTTGNFEALIKAVVIDQESDVPQVGVGVYFRVKGGPGEIPNQGPVRTDNSGRAETVLVGRGATSGNDITVEVSSGPATAEITLDVLGCFSSTAVPPVLVYSLSATTVTVQTDLTVTLTSSTDSDCPGGKPTSWKIQWGDGDEDTDTFANGTTKAHQYASSFVPSTPPGQTRTATLTIEVTDCQGLTDRETTTVTVRR